MASTDALKALVDALVAEQERRRTARQQAGDADRAWLLAKLGDMHECLTKAPGYVAPTAEEKEQMIAKLEVWFREHGYDIAG